MLLSMYSQGQPGGSQAVGPAASLAGTAGQINQANTWNAFNANNFNYWANKYGNYGNQQSTLTGSAWGDFALNTGIQGAKTAAEIYFAK
jgi:hypothetical protein